jgi:PAS domain S-box-containing protein
MLIICSIAMLISGHSLVQEFITQDYQASVQAVLDRALDGVETANFEFPLITKAGARIEVLLNATTRRNEHGKVIGVVGIGQDITGKISYPILFTQHSPVTTFT